MQSPKKKNRSNLTEQEQRDNRQAMKVIVFVVAGLSLFTVVIGIINAVFNAVETSNVIDIYGEDLARACQASPIGTASTDNAPTDAEPPYGTILLITGTQRRHAWHTNLPTAWQATNTEEVDVVGCVEEDWVTIETCEYERPSVRGEGSYTIDIDREQFTVTMTLINPDTGRIIAEETLTGTEPDACPADEEVTVSGSQQGGELELRDFTGWMEPYIIE